MPPVRVAGLSGVFIKTHRHTLKNKLPGCQIVTDYNFPPGADCHSTQTDEKPITQRQKDSFEVGRRQGPYNKRIDPAYHEKFNKHLEDLNRVEAHQIIQNING